MISKVVLFLAVATIALAEYIPIKDIHVPQPYSFGYKIKDKHGEQYREETGDGKEVVKGSYGFVDEKGIKRQVFYVADKFGFRAEVKTNEPGTANQDPAAVKMISTAYDGIGGLGYGGEGLALGGEAIGYGAGGLGYGIGGGIGGGAYY